MRRLGTSIAAGVALATAATLFVTPASAAPSTGGYTAPSEDRTYTVANPSVTDVLIATWDPYVELSGGRYVINAPDSVVLADPDGYAQAARIVAQTNATLAANGLTGSKVTYPLLRGSSGAAIASTGSHGEITSYWWGWSMWLDHWATGRLTAIFNAGAGVSGVAAGIMSWTGVGGALAGVVAAVLWAGGAIFALCDWNDRGINYRYVTLVGSVCWAR